MASIEILGYMKFRGYLGELTMVSKRFKVLSPKVVSSFEE